MMEIVIDFETLSIGETIIAALTTSVSFTAFIFAWCITLDKEERKTQKYTLLKCSLIAIVMAVLTVAICCKWVNAILLFVGTAFLVPLAVAIYSIFIDNNKIKY